MTLKYHDSTGSAVLSERTQTFLPTIRTSLSAWATIYSINAEWRSSKSITESSSRSKKLKANQQSSSCSTASSGESAQQITSTSSKVESYRRSKTATVSKTETKTRSNTRKFARCQRIGGATRSSSRLMKATTPCRTWSLSRSSSS